MDGEDWFLDDGSLVDNLCLENCLKDGFELGLGKVFWHDGCFVFGVMFSQCLSYVVVLGDEFLLVFRTGFVVG